MSQLRVESFTISLDGFGSGPDQDLANPLGVCGTSLHGWAMSTRTFQSKLFGNTEGGATGTDHDFAQCGFQNMGAGFWGATCSASCAGLGPMRAGAAGGRTTRSTTCRWAAASTPSSRTCA